MGVTEKSGFKNRWEREPRHLSVVSISEKVGKDLQSPEADEEPFHARRRTP